MTLNTLAPLQNQVDVFFTAWTQGSSGVAYTRQGLAVAGTQGVLRNVASAALLALIRARHSSGFGAARLACWARDQVYTRLHSRPALASPVALALNHLMELHRRDALPCRQHLCYAHVL